MTARDVVVLGEALWDLYPARPHEKLRVRRVEHRCLGGAPANVASTLARLGLDVAMIAAVGNDALGAGIADQLRAAGVDTAAVTSVERRTGVTFVELEDGEPSFIPYRVNSADTALVADDVPPLRASFLHLGSSSFAACPAATARALERAAKEDVRVSIDLNIYPFWFRDGTDALDGVISGADVVKASEIDLQRLGVSRPEALHARRPHGITVVTRGARGTLAWSRNLEIELPAKRARVVDASGAGDAFMAGLLAGLIRGSGKEANVLLYALRLGSTLAARAVTALGATTALHDLAKERSSLARAAEGR